MQNFLHHSRGGTEKVKTLRKQCAIAILTLTLAVSAFAGQTNTPGAVADNGTTTTLTGVVLTIITIVP
jgi:hypothetical protein